MDSRTPLLAGNLYSSAYNHKLVEDSNTAGCNKVGYNTDVVAHKFDYSHHNAGCNDAVYDDACNNVYGDDVNVHTYGRNGARDVHDQIDGAPCPLQPQQALPKPIQATSAAVYLPVLIF